MRRSGASVTQAHAWVERTARGWGRLAVVPNEILLAPSILAADYAVLADEVARVRSEVGLGARRPDGRPLRAEPLHRTAGGDLAPQAHGPVPGLPSDGHRPRVLARAARRGRREPVQRPRRARRPDGAARAHPGSRDAGGSRDRRADAVRGGRALPRRPDRPPARDDDHRGLRRPAVRARAPVEGRTRRGGPVRRRARLPDRGRRRDQPRDREDIGPRRRRRRRGRDRDLHRPDPAAAARAIRDAVSDVRARNVSPR